MRPLRCVVLLALLSLTAAGCFQDPRAWPIPQLTLPAAAQQARLPDHFANSTAYGDSSDGSNIFPNEQSRSWGKSFNYALGWDALGTDIDGKLKPLGYTDYSGPEMDKIPNVPGLKKTDIMRGWLAPDGAYKVAIVNYATMRERGAQGCASCDYMLIIDRAKP